MKYDVVFSQQAHKYIKKLTPKLREKAKDIIRNRIAVDPYSGKHLVGNLKGYFSVRLTYKDRIVYSVDDGRVVVFIVSAKTHYRD